MSKVSVDPLLYLISDSRIQRPRYLTEIYHWEREKVNDPRMKSRKGVYVFFDKAGNVAYIGKTAPFGDGSYLSGSKRKKNYRQSRVKRHFNGKGGNWSWEFYYKVRLYEFMDDTSRDIYELWWIDKLQPYGNKSNRYYRYWGIMPNSSIRRDNWSSYQRNAFREKVSPEEYAIWQYWKRTSGGTMDVKQWVQTQKRTFIISLVHTKIDLFNFMRDVRRKSR